MATRLIAFLLLAGIYSKSYAQNCNSATAYQCDFSQVEELDGFSAANLTACLLKGQSTAAVIPFKVFETLNFGGGTDTIYRMRIESISNLPCGLCWGSSAADNIFVSGQTGCIALSGITSGTSGQYVLNVILSFDTNNNGAFNQSNKTLATLLTTNNQLVLRLVGPDEDCIPVNYSLQGQTASTNCQ